ncbi:MAG TPA: MBL fold metallo-hydrolase [Trebonia sp.]|nr:MBL fold metallo-hydrolase [Trebonia sp.]
MVRITLVGGPTAVLEVGGLRLVTDPTFDPPGSYQRPGAPTLVKVTPPAVSAVEAGQADAVLLSHDQHADNLDTAGRAYLTQVPLTLTTPASAARLAEDGIAARALAPWQHADLARPGAEPVRVTAVPARHGPEGCEPLSGDVTGFVLTAPDIPTIYLSGDNAWLGAVEQVAARFGPVGVAVLFAGAARLPAVFDGALLTLDSDLAAAATRALGARYAVPVHYTGWQHFSEGSGALRAAFDRADLADRLVLLAPGEEAVLGDFDSEALAVDMVAASERLGLYDADADATRAALKAARKRTEG